MTYIVDFFNKLGDILTSIVEFIIDFFTGLADFFLSIPDYVAVIDSFFELVPDPIKVFFVMVLSFSLIFIIIGRRGK